MATTEAYSGQRIEHLMMGTNGTAGDVIYLSTGSGMTYKSSTATGTDATATAAFIGILEDSCSTGDYVSVLCEGVVQLDKTTTADVIEASDRVYLRNDAVAQTVGTLAGGTAIGIAAKRSGSTDTYVSTLLIPFYVSGAPGFHA